jgi:hypothetical protein
MISSPSRPTSLGYAFSSIASRRCIGRVSDSGAKTESGRSFNIYILKIADVETG